MEFKFSRRDFAFLAIFGIAALVAARINFSQALGAPNQYFTMFQFFGPVAAAFIGPVLGIGAILASEVVNVILLGKSFTLLEIARLFPMLFASYYFVKFGKGKLVQVIVPLACIILFISHPVGAQAWFFSLYWLIPALATLFPLRLFARSLGATFTAHAIGGVVWLYLLPTTPAFWVALIPIVAFERLMFASGISVSYVAFNTLLARVEFIVKSGVVAIDGRYVLFSPHT